MLVGGPYVMVYHNNKKYSVYILSENIACRY